MLLDGLNHVAVITNDTDRLHTFYGEVFGATVAHEERHDGRRFSIVHIGPHTELNVFEVDGNTEATRQVSLFFRDPDGLEAEVCVPNPDAEPGVFNAPGTPAKRFVGSN